jgi:hypothetical protein
LLTDEELSLAIAEKVVHPDMKRALLERWRKSRKLGHVPSPKDAAASDSPAVSLPIHSTQDAVESGVLPSTSDDSQDNEEELAAAPDDAPAPEAVAPAAEVASPPAQPLSDEDIPAFLDRRPLSPEDQRAFDVIKVAWDRHLQPLLLTASAVVRERIIAEVIRANASSRSAAEPSSRRDDDVGAIPSAMPSRPTISAVLAHTADDADAFEAEKAEPAKEAPLSAKPRAPDAADAGIKYRDLHVPGFMPARARPVVVVRRKRRRPKKASGPLDDLPF